MWKARAGGQLGAVVGRAGLQQAGLHVHWRAVDTSEVESSSKVALPHQEGERSVSCALDREGCELAAHGAERAARSFFVALTSHCNVSSPSAHRNRTCARGVLLLFSRRCCGSPRSCKRLDHTQLLPA